MSQSKLLLPRWVVAVYIFVGIGHSAWSTTGAEVSPESAARNLVRRVLPAQTDRFVFERIDPQDGQDVFEVEGREDQVIIRGNTGVSMAVGLQWYMRNHGYGLVSWSGGGTLSPHSPQPVMSKLRRVSWAKHRYFLNYCTFTYSMAWWDWQQWERLIDWMALNGVTLPLSVTGQEAVWQAVCRRLGLNDAEIEEFLPGPAFLPFGWMGTLDGWGGPLPQRWIDRHAELQSRILARQRELGMTPVLQGFTGHVPPALGRKFPDAILHRIRWVDWETHVLDPHDPLFAKIARLFMEEQEKLFSTDHFYAADTFIEMTPPSRDPKFLSGLGRAIYEGMAQTDSRAVWLLQDWTFHNQREFWATQDRIKLFLGAVPQKGMLVLNDFGEARPTRTWNSTEGFYGKPWVWCLYQNFGDMVQLGGAMNRINSDLEGARKHALGSALSGVGAMGEGLGYSPAIQSLLFEVAWRDPSRVDLQAWVRSYSRHRYGKAHPEAETAWGILGETAYAGPCPPLGRSLLLAIPTLVPEKETEPDKLWLRELPYENRRLARAWPHLLKAAEELGAVDSYRFDLVNVARQVLSNHAETLHAEVVKCYEREDLDELERAARRFLDLGRDLDELLATRPEFLLGRWLEDARRWGATEEERARLEWNARLVLTLWGKVEHVGDFPRDYARKEWSGMLTGFYLKRWESFFRRLAESLGQGKEFDNHAFQLELLQWERDWTKRRDPYPAEPHGDSLTVAKKLWAKYGRRALNQVSP